MSWTDDLTGKTIIVDGVTFPARKKIQFTGDDVSGVDKPGSDTTEINISTSATAQSVPSVFGRSGAVVAEAGDYGAEKVDYDPLGSRLSSVTVQSAIDELAGVVNTETAAYDILPSESVLFSDSTSNLMTFTITDSSDFKVGHVVEIVQSDSGQVTLVEGAGTTIKRSRFATLELAGRYSTVRLRKQSAGTWIVSGDLKEETPLLTYRITDVLVAEGAIFKVTGAEGIGGFSSGQTEALFEIPHTGTYLITTNIAFNWSEPTDSARIAEITVQASADGSTGWTDRGTGQAFRETGGNSGLDRGVNFSFVRRLNAGDFLRVLPQNSSTVGPANSSEDKNECSLLWIGD